MLSTIEERAVEKYRDINTHDGWWEAVYEVYTEKMAERGVTVQDINFSGFWSQGDGASFTGNITQEDMSRFMDLHMLAERYPSVYYFALRKEVYAKIVRTSSRYCHEYTVETNVLDMMGNPYGDDDPRGDVYSAMEVMYLNEYREFEQEMQETLQGYMKSLYYDLSKEYDYLTSDECVLDTLKANDMINEEEEEEDGVCCN